MVSTARRPRGGFTVVITDDPDAIVPSMAKKLREMQERVNTGEREGLLARWEMGRLMLPWRAGRKQLSKGQLANIEEITGLGRVELGRRMRFADRYPDEDELRHAMTKFPTWFEIVKEGLYDKRAKPEGSSLRLVLPGRLKGIAAHIEELDRIDPTDTAVTDLMKVVIHEFSRFLKENGISR